MEKILKGVKDIAKTELKDAIIKHGLFASAHEGNDVLREEIEEAKAEFNALEHFKLMLDNAIKNNDTEMQGVIIESIKRRSLLLCAESVQVLAMAYKYDLFLKGHKSEVKTQIFPEDLRDYLRGV